MCKDIGTSDQSTDLGAHLWAILISDFLRASPKAKYVLAILPWLKYLLFGMVRLTLVKICKLFSWKSLCKKCIISFLVVSQSSGVDQDPIVLGPVQLISEHSCV